MSQSIAPTPIYTKYPTLSFHRTSRNAGPDLWARLLSMLAQETTKQLPQLHRDDDQELTVDGGLR